MFIYKITVIPINKVYIGFDSNEEYKKLRWKTHCRNVKKGSGHGKLYKAMSKYGIENCIYEVIDRCKTFGEMIISEIDNIAKYDSYKYGLNSSLGGDGLGKNNLWKLSDDEFRILKETMGKHFQEFNKKKWANITPEQRKEFIKRTHTLEANVSRAKSLKEYYKAHPEVLASKRERMKKMRNENKEQRDADAKHASDKAAIINARFITVKLPNGEIKTYKSRKEFQLDTGQWFVTLRKKKVFNDYELLHCKELLKLDKPKRPKKSMSVKLPSGEIKKFASRKEFSNETGISAFYMLKKKTCKGYILINE